ncbi:Glucans biosynthesis protein G precursor [Phaeobacter sp. CECT 5382]|uniref:glucan biosynthesis protein n=1 Tax=Phaeobacter sp. CECT 5382 TaxID=1712645 RepID=UPI0006DB5F47|nr:glucan biosynthesis protein G [Phaeobacter sp. CECT 5382]CUH86215.1 Glucans biosynthesis protein G precursor [Phaeobacter sp. CECT 5382]
MNHLTRRAFLGAALSSTVLSSALLTARPAAAAGNEASPFRHDQVIERARALAAQDYAPRAEVPQDWLDMSYDEYKAHRFRTQDAIWSGTDRSYNVDLFLPGLYFRHAVQVNTVTDGMSRPFGFDMSLFDRRDIAPDLSTTGALGYSGLRLRTQLDQPNKKTEFCVFQGASYFRAIGVGQSYGLSARGLALKTGDPMGEEFPDFIEFWLEAPAPGQRSMVVHALMDSPSVTGAYRFTVTPGANTVMDVEARLFARTDLSHAGLAPLTSMFLFDRTNRNRFDDFRPNVHDSDGLLIKNGNQEVLWRPLANPAHLQISSFVDENPRGFGLMQRSRHLADFEDLEANYHRRPSLWVEPKGDWGKGAVTLVEIPADKEIYDNIVAYWRPQDSIEAGSEVPLSYRLSWGEDPHLDLARVIDTAAGARIFGEPGRLMTVDFEAHPLLEGAPEDFEVHLSSPHVELSEGVLQRNPATGGLRLAFSFAPNAENHVELRLQLRRDGTAASEVWLYRWTA